MFSKRRIKNEENSQPEDFRIQLDIIFRDFAANEDQEVYTFPNTLTNDERKYIHLRSSKLGFKSKSTGKAPNRTLSISKKNRNTNREFCELELTEESLRAINVMNFPDILHNKNYKVSNVHETLMDTIKISHPVQVPEASTKSFDDFRSKLPVHKFQKYLLDMIEQHPVTLVCAETGSGKTTQIPQYILEDCMQKQRPCRVICTQPRRISTTSVAKRVATERGENVGSTIGYQIKLDVNMSKFTALLYCTTGILLRSLMVNGEKFLNNNVTHIILDEIHERDKFTDFLLICIKQLLPKCPKLKVVLMSATADTKRYEDYFKDYGMQTVYIPGRSFEITYLYLDEILPLINYDFPGMKSAFEYQSNMTRVEFKKDESLDAIINNEEEYDEDLADEMNSILVACMESGSNEMFHQLMELVLNEDAPVNYREPSNGYTPLIVAAVHGETVITEQLLNMGTLMFILTC